MNNYELDEKAKELADGHSAYELARRVLEVEGRRDELEAHCERLRESINDLMGVVELDSEIDPDHLLVCAAREVMNETPDASLAHVRAEAIEDLCREWAQEARELPAQHEHKGRGCCTYNWQMHYVKRGEKYANAIRQSASQSGGGDATGND